MKITLHIATTLSPAAFTAAAIRGLVSTSDAGEAIIAALEAAAPSPGDRKALTRTEAAAALSAHEGNVSAAAASLGVARSTVRYALRAPICPACETRPGILDGYCADCDAGLRADYDARRGGDEWKP